MNHIPGFDNEWISHRTLVHPHPNVAIAALAYFQADWRSTEDNVRVEHDHDPGAGVRCGGLGRPQLSRLGPVGLAGRPDAGERRRRLTRKFAPLEDSFLGDGWRWSGAKRVQ